MAVVVAVFTPYRWLDCDFSWQDERLQRPLRAFGTTAFATRFEEAALLGDTDIYCYGKGIEEMALLREAARCEVVWRRWLCEGLALREGKRLGAGPLFKEAARLGEERRCGVVPALAEVLVLAESAQRGAVWRRWVHEGASLADGEQGRYETRVGEFLAASDRRVSRYGFAPVEVLALGDVLTRVFRVKLDVEEPVGVASGHGKVAAIAALERIGAQDALMQAARLVLSNMTIAGTELTLNDFVAALNRVPGYESFAEYRVGDYEYERALVRLIVESQAVGAEPIVYGAAIHVDIEDTDDRGTAQITSTTEPTKVYFHKFYYHAPEVVVAVKGGSTANGVITPKIVSIGDEDLNGRYFEVELQNAVGERVQGSITWTSKGY